MLPRVPVPAVAAVYAKTIVTVEEGGRFVPIQESQLLTRGRVHVITAWNPGDVRPSDAENRAANEALRGELVGMGYQPIPAIGADPDSDHAEESWAVLGLNKLGAQLLGARYGQVAVFRIEPGLQTVIGCSEEWELSVRVGPVHEGPPTPRPPRKAAEWVPLVEFGSSFGSTMLFVKRTSRTISVRIKHGYFDEEYSFRRSRMSRVPRGDAATESRFLCAMFDSAFTEAVDPQWAITTDGFVAAMESIGAVPWNDKWLKKGERKRKQAELDDEERRARWLAWSDHPHVLGS